MNAIHDSTRHLVCSGPAIFISRAKAIFTCQTKPTEAARARYVGLKYREVQLPAGLNEGYESALIGDSENFMQRFIYCGNLKRGLVPGKSISPSSSS